MGFYWARFEKYYDNIYRFDTRIYFESVDEVKVNDECVGAIVGKNPGSALPKDDNFGMRSEIELKNDKLLPTVRKIIRKSNPLIGGRKYVQVLNLFYLCDPNLGEAIKDFENSKNPDICHTEKKVFPWLWFMWGGYNKNLTEKKLRFKSILASKRFYLDNKTKNVHEEFPADRVCAKHTQGMQHDLVVPYLTEILK